MAEDDNGLDDDTVVEETDDEDESSTDIPSSESGSIGPDSAGITPTKMAKNALRKANKQENAGSITLFGDTMLVAGVTVDLKNFGKFSQKYIVAKATHKISGGYTTDIEIRRCLNGY